MSDLIDRKQALKDYQDKLCEAVSCVNCPFCIDRLYGGCKVEKYLINLPSAEKTGKWIPSIDRWGDIITTVDGYTCSECGTFNADKDNYCSNCGADMQKEHENESI